MHSYYHSEDLITDINFFHKYFLKCKIVTSRKYDSNSNLFEAKWFFDFTNSCNWYKRIDLEGYDAQMNICCLIT